MRILKCIGTLAAPLLLTGCAALSGLSLPSPQLPGGSKGADIHSQTSVSLEQANFALLQTNLVGKAKGFALLGIITIVPAKFDTALGRLYDKTELQTGKSQTLAHLVVERSSVYLILFSIPLITVRADVVEFVPNSVREPAR